MALIPGLVGKTKAAVVAALLFFIISNPMTYKLMDSILGALVGRIASPSGCPTTLGMVVHSAVFGVATYYGVSF